MFLINWRSLRGRVTPWSGTYGNTPYNRGLPFQDSPDWWTEADGLFGRSPTDSSCLTNSHLINRSWCLFKLRFLYFNHSPLEISKLKNLKIFWNSEIQKKWSKNLLKKEKMLNRSIILTRTNFKNFSTLHNMKWTKFSDKDNNALPSDSRTLNPHPWILKHPKRGTVTVRVFRETNPERSITSIDVCFCALDFYSRKVRSVTVPKIHG